jgi:hypothetical protein
MMTEPVDYLGSKLRALAAEHGSGVTQLGSLFVRVTNHGSNWALELNDDKPIGGAVIDEWYKATGVPHGSTWRCAYGAMEWRCEWQGTEDAAPEGTPAFYLGGAHA